MKKGMTVLAGLLTAAMFTACGFGGAVDSGGIDGGSTGGSVEGADWRTWGIIDAYGTLEAEGSSTDLCVCLYADRAELYYNEESQNLFKTIEYPETLTTEQYENVTITFEDLDGDDNTDITIGSITPDGAERRFSYVYDMGEYVYMEALSYPPANYDVDGSESAEYEDEVYEGQGYYEYEGVYTEPPTGRCTISITSKGEGAYRVVIAWSSSAYQLACWEIENANLSSDGTELEYTDAVYYTTTYNKDDESYDREDIYSDGTGKFFFNEDGKLGWISNNSDLDETTGDVFFEKLQNPVGGEG